MKIINIQPNYTTFRAKDADYISKRMLSYSRKRLNDAKKTNQAILDTLAAASISGIAVNEILRERGFTYCSVNNDTVHTAAGYNGGFYSVKYDAHINPEQLKVYFVQSVLKGDNLKIGGLLNYKEMIKDLKRQDIIQKGLQLHTYELNTSISEEDAKSAAARLAKLSKKYVKPKDLFFIDSDAYYYDKIDKKAYSICVNSSSYDKAERTFRACEFKKDSKGNAVGYTQNYYDIFQNCRVDKVYEEQQEPSEKLPEIADASNNKMYAESFRFGNTERYSVKIENAIPLVINHLEEKVGVKSATKDMLQVVRLYKGDMNRESRICFYDSSTGRSLVYDDQGNYLYQMEYNKDAQGRITACSKY